jgi:hypothetical protein
VMTNHRANENRYTARENSSAMQVKRTVRRSIDRFV